MGLLIKAVQVCDLQSPFHNQTVDISINDDGIIDNIGKLEGNGQAVIDGKGMKVSTGWVDMHANFNDPGLEHKEDVFSGMEAAQFGGFSDVVVLPNTKPTIQSKSDIIYLRQRAAQFVSQIHPMAAVTLGVKGEELTEMIDLHHAGAIAFTDGEHAIWHTDILMKALLYLQQIDGLLINMPEDRWLAANGVMHEGIASTLSGMKGIPSLAESLMLKRDLMLLEFVGGKIHFAGVSSAESVQMIREAKQKGLNVTCDVPVYQLLLNDNDVVDFDTNYKVKPPLRTEQDRLALIEGIKDNTIDVIASYHCPQDTESKCLEFDLAEFGITSLATFLPNLVELSHQIPMEMLIEKITAKPRAILKLQRSTIKKGEKACLTIFDEKEKWTFDGSTNFSKSINSPWYGKELVGRVKLLVVGKKLFSTSAVKL
jgi:dihydroorotase